MYELSSILRSTALWIVIGRNNCVFCFCLTNIISLSCHAIVTTIGVQNGLKDGSVGSLTLKTSLSVIAPTLQWMQFPAIVSYYFMLVD